MRTPLIRRLLLLVSLAAVAFCASLFLGSAEPIAPARFNKIRNGMTEAEVNAIFGVPAGDHSTRPGFPYCKDSSIFINRVNQDMRRWSSDRWFVTIWLDDDGHVVEKVINPSIPYDMIPEGKDFLDPLRWKVLEWRLEFQATTQH